MNTRQIAVVCVLVVVGAGALAVPSVAFHTAGVEAIQTADDDAELGVQVSSFAQASATDASESVDAGIWEIRANASANPGAEIRNRTAALENRLERLEARTKQLEDRRENLSKAAYNARASALRVQVANIRSHVEQVNKTAARKGVNTTKLDELRGKAGNVTGPEVAQAARNITDPPRGPPGNNGDPGPPSEKPGRGNGNGNGDAPRENESSAGDGMSGAGPDRGQSNENGTDRGGPDENGTDRGGPNENKTDGGPPEGDESTGNAPSGEQESGPQDANNASAERGQNSGDREPDTPDDRGSNGNDATDSENPDSGSAEDEDDEEDEK